MKLIHLAAKEWLLAVSSISFVLTIILSGRLPSYSIDEFKVLLILYALFVAVKGLESNHLISAIAYKIESGSHIAPKLIIGTWVLSMLFTNDVSLVIMVPITMLLSIAKKELIVIMEAIAANAGSALTPFGNPQNLFIYWHYHLDFYDFIRQIAPFAIFFLIFLTIVSFAIKEAPQNIGDKITIDQKGYIFVILFLTVVAVSLRILPVYCAGIVIIAAIIIDLRSLRVDYALLLSFILFFGIANNLEDLVSIIIDHNKDIFLYSLLSSQIISNVPTSLIFAGITPDWADLLWGVSAGGFGLFTGSLANLIALKIYIKGKNLSTSMSFVWKFLLYNTFALIISVALFYMLKSFSLIP